MDADQFRETSFPRQNLFGGCKSRLFFVTTFEDSVLAVGCRVFLEYDTRGILAHATLLVLADARFSFSRMDAWPEKRGS